ncbi:MAG: glycosyltransferase family 4 protein [Deltaproteobacteria bacterium]
MMQMCMVIYGSLDTLTGGFLYDKFLVKHLRRKGHEIQIVSLPWRRYGQHLLDNFSPMLRSALAIKIYDLILQDELNHPSLFLLNRKLRKLGHGPIVSIVHQVLSRQPRGRIINRLFQTIEKIYLSSVDAFIFNSETTRQSVRSLIGATGPFIVANPAGTRLGHLGSSEIVKERSFRSGPLDLVFVGNITPVKGLIPLIESVALLPPTIWRLTIVGSLALDPKYVRRVKDLIASKNVGQQVHIKGQLDGEKLINILSNSHLFVMPFSCEGFGIAPLEALGFGLPVMGPSAGAVKEFIQPGVNGFLIDATDSNALCKHIKDLHRNRQKLAQMGSAALATYHGRPSWNETMESIHHFLKTLI